MMLNVTDEMVYAAIKEAVARGLLPKGASQEEAVVNFETFKAVLQAATVKDSNPVEPDLALENLAFESAAAQIGLQLDKLQGGFYASDVTQHAWAMWVRRAAMHLNSERLPASCLS